MWIRREESTAVDRLGSVFGCLDFAVTPGGEHVFFEVNPRRPMPRYLMATEPRDVHAAEVALALEERGAEPLLSGPRGGVSRVDTDGDGGPDAALPGPSNFTAGLAFAAVAATPCPVGWCPGECCHCTPRIYNPRWNEPLDNCRRDPDDPTQIDPDHLHCCLLLQAVLHH